jgi:cysteine-S-conjugate beta-lyase
MSKKETDLLYLGRDPNKYGKCVNTPIYRSSTFIYETVEDFLHDEKPAHTDIAYGRSGTPTIHELESAMASLEGTDHCLLTSSGMSAICIAILSFARSGDHILIPDNAYKCSRRFAEEELPKMGIECTYYDPNLTDGLRELIKPNTKIIMMESPGSGTYEVQDVPAICKIAQSKNITTIIDSTWATPLFFNPRKYGVDVIVESLTKYISGHADIIMGAICFDSKHNNAIRSTFRNYGAIPSPDNAYLALRGLRTLNVRIKQHETSAIKIAQWLEKHDKVVKVMHPGLESAETHHLWRRDFSGSTGVFGVVLKKTDISALYKAINMLQFFAIGLSWGGYESLIVPYDLHKSPSISKRIPQGNCIRLNIGLENPDDLIQDLDKVLKNL